MIYTADNVLVSGTEKPGDIISGDRIRGFDLDQSELAETVRIRLLSPAGDVWRDSTHGLVQSWTFEQV